MKRFFAVVGIVAFLAACSDSNSTAPVSQLKPGAALHSPGDPPPPPLSGDDGSGALQVGFSEAAAPAAQTTNPCVATPHFTLNYAWSYLESNGGNNQVVHLHLDGSPTSGDIMLHDTQSGKSITHGTVSNTLFSFDIQNGSSNSLSQSSFDYTVTGILTDLTTGAKCQGTAELSGSLNESESTD